MDTNIIIYHRAENFSNEIQKSLQDSQHLYDLININCYAICNIHGYLSNSRNKDSEWWITKSKERILKSIRYTLEITNLFEKSVGILEYLFTEVLGVEYLDPKSHTFLEKLVKNSFSEVQMILELANISTVIVLLTNKIIRCMNAFN